SCLDKALWSVHGAVSLAERERLVTDALLFGVDPTRSRPMMTSRSRSFFACSRKAEPIAQLLLAFTAKRSGRVIQPTSCLECPRWRRGRLEGFETPEIEGLAANGLNDPLGCEARGLCQQRPFAQALA